MANVPPTVPINPASSERELLVQLLLLVDAGQTDTRERLQTIMADITTLQNNLAALQTAVGAMKPLLDQSVALGQRAIGVLDSLAGQIANLQPTQAAIDALAAQAADAVSQLTADNAEITSGNAAVQAELDKVSPPSAAPAKAPGA